MKKSVLAGAIFMTLTLFSCQKDLTNNSTNEVTSSPKVEKSELPFKSHDVPVEKIEADNTPKANAGNSATDSKSETTTSPVMNTYAPADEAYFNEHVAFVEFGRRSVSLTKFVKTIELKAFYQPERLPQSFNLDGVTYMDNGQVNDLVSGDGIYTTGATYEKSVENALLGGKVYERSNLAVVDPQFQHRSELALYLNGTGDEGPVGDPTGLSKDGPTVKASIDCDVKFGTCGCYADEWGWCDCCCVTFYNCKVHIEGSWGK